MTQLLGSTRIVGDDLATALYEAGVRIAFGMDDPRGYWLGLRRSKIRAVIVHDERSGAFMAEAFTRVGGGLATCSGISGPGAANLVPGLLEAWLSSVPVIAVLGEKRSNTFGGREFQGVDHKVLLSGVTKATVEVVQADDIRAGAEQAVRLATSGRPRPVLLLTRDLLQQQESDGAVPTESLTTTSAGLHPMGARSGGAHQDDIDEAVKALTQSQRIVIVAGGGAAISGSGPTIMELAERVGATIVATPMGKGTIPEDHPLAIGIIYSYSCGPGGFGVVPLERLREADCVVVVGSDLDSLAVVDGQWPTPGTRIIRIDIDPNELLSHADIALCGDAASVVTQLVGTLPDEVQGAQGRLATAQSDAIRAQEGRKQVIADDLANDPGETVWPARVVAEVSKVLGANDVIVTDASFSSAWCVDRVVAVAGAPTLVTPRAGGTLGWGLPAALGAQLARPTSRIIGIIGDGALFFSIGDMETAVRENLPVTIIVLDNGIYGSQRHSNLLAQGKDHGDLHFNSRSDLAMLARSFGWSAERVTSARDLTRLLANPAAGPQMIIVAVDPNHRPPIFKFSADPSLDS